MKKLILVLMVILSTSLFAESENNEFASNVKELKEIVENIKDWAIGELYRACNTHDTMLIYTLFWPTFTLNIDPLSFPKVAVKASLRLIGISLDSHFRK